ncbi:MAG: response regulator [Anaerolineae bacterium]|nr:response regulator [Anaerolineae bacterium]
MSEKKWRILYVEDQAEMIDLMRVVVRSRPIEVIGAANAAEAIRILHTEPPDLVLLDIMLPEVDGWAVHHEIINTPELRDIPIIVITARGSLEEQEEGLRMPGVMDYIIKPFSPAELLASVDRILQQREKRHPTAGPAPAHTGG